MKHGEGDPATLRLCPAESGGRSSRPGRWMMVVNWTERQHESFHVLRPSMVLTAPLVGYRGEMQVYYMGNLSAPPGDLTKARIAASLRRSDVSHNSTTRSCRGALVPKSGS